MNKKGWRMAISVFLVPKLGRIIAFSEIRPPTTVGSPLGLISMNALLVHPKMSTFGTV